MVRHVRGALPLRLYQIPVRARSAVLHGKRRQLRRADAEGARDRPEVYHRTVQAKRVRLRGDVREQVMHGFHRLGCGVAAQNLLAVQRVEAAHVVEAADVVHVRVREHHRVHLGDVQLQAGQAELRRRVYHERRLPGAHVNA